MSPACNILAGALAMAGAASAGILRGTDNLISMRDVSKADEEPIIKAAEEATKMSPIRPDHEAKSRRRKLKKRAAGGGVFDLMKEESLWWGDRSGTVAELRIKMPGDTEGIVDTEYFDDLIESMECPEDGDGELKMKFTEQGDFSTAAGGWSWVNQESDNHFLLMVGAEDCGNNEDRMVYNVKDIDMDNDANTATLTVEATTWKDSLHSYNLNLGNIAMGKNQEMARRLMQKNKRQLGEWIGNVVEDIGEGVDDAVNAVEDVADDVADKAEGVFNNVTESIEPVIDGANEFLDQDINPSFSIPLDFDVSGKGINFNTGGVDFIGMCTECTATGSFDVEASFSMEFFEFDEAFIELSTPGIEAKAIVAATIRGKLTDSLVEKSLPLFKASPAGIAIPGIITIGPTVAIEIKAGITGIQGGTTLTLGGTMNIPESFSRLDFLDEEAMTSEGWEPEFVPTPLKADVFVEARATTSLSGSVGVEISALGKFLSILVLILTPFPLDQ